MRNFDIKIKDNNIVVALLEGANKVETSARRRYQDAVDKDSSVAYYAMKLAEAEVIYTSLDYTWHRNHYNSLKSYAGTDPVSRAELAVDKAKLAASKAKDVAAAAAFEEAEQAWLNG